MPRFVVLTVALVPLLVLSLLSATRGGEEAAKTPVELGRVAWTKGFDRATEVAKQEGKPLLVLFQEVPG